MISPILTPALRRLTWLAFLGMFLVCVDLARAAEPVLTPAQTINIAGRQRMLTQQIVKTYVQIGLGITPELSRRQLADGVRLFETQLSQLRHSAPDAQTRQSLAGMGKLWRRFKFTATGAVNPSGAETLLGMDGELLAAAHELTQAARQG